MNYRGRKPSEYGWVWVRVMKVRHWKSGKMMVRKDGKPFVFRVKRKKNKTASELPHWLYQTNQFRLAIGSALICLTNFAG